MKSARKTHGIKYSRHSSLKLGIIALGCLILLILLSKVINIAESLNRPYAPDSLLNSSKNLLWDGKTTFNIAVKADQIYLLSFNPQKTSVVVIVIPDNTYLNVPFDYGFWTAGSIYKLGQAEKVGKGAELLKSTLEINLGLPIHGYLIINGNLASISPFDLTTKIRQNPLTILNLLGQSKTDLSLLEYKGFFTGLRQARFDKVEVINLTEKGLSSPVTLADGSQVLKINQPKFDSLWQQNFADDTLKDEALSIGIYNSTKHPGLAEKATRVINNLGGKVVFTANSSKVLDKSLVMDGSFSAASIIAQFFAPFCSKNESTHNLTVGVFSRKNDKSSCINNLENIDVSKADINIFLGEDYFLRYNTP